MMFKLALNAGHAPTTAGKRCLKSIDPNETREYFLNSRICDKIQNKLAQYDGVEVLRIDDGVSDLNATQRAKKANSLGADFYLAIHHNALGKNVPFSGGGFEAYTYLKVNETTKAWQVALCNEVLALTGLKGNRANPLRQADFGECRDTNMDAVLLECGFMDSTTDVPIILTDDFAEKVATACVNVIVARAGLTPKSKYGGSLDGILRADSGTYAVWGWALNKRTPTKPLEIHIYFYRQDGSVALCRGGIMADKYREDLKQAGISNGYNGFSDYFDLSAVCPNEVVTMKAFLIGDGCPQLAGEHTITVEPPIVVEVEQTAPAQVKVEEVQTIAETVEAETVPADEVVELVTDDIVVTKKGILDLIYQILQAILKWFNK